MQDKKSVTNKLDVNTSKMQSPTLDELDIDTGLDNDSAFISNRRGMRPPVSGKNDERKSVTSRKNEDNNSITSGL